jgi:hypothetical protein
MEQSPSCEAGSSSPNPEIVLILWNPKVTLYYDNIFTRMKILFPYNKTN